MLGSGCLTFACICQNALLSEVASWQLKIRTSILTRKLLLFIMVLGETIECSVKYYNGLMADGG